MSEGMLDGSVYQPSQEKAEFQTACDGWSNSHLLAQYHPFNDHASVVLVVVSSATVERRHQQIKS